MDPRLLDALEGILNDPHWTANRDDWLKEVRKEDAEARSRPLTKYEPGPGTFLCHELMDRLTLTQQLFWNLIAGHPSCFMNEEWFTKATVIWSLLSELETEVMEQHGEAAPEDMC
jgi:hypothetical protein